MAWELFFLLPEVLVPVFAFLCKRRARDSAKSTWDFAVAIDSYYSSSLKHWDRYIVSKIALRILWNKIYIYGVNVRDLIHFIARSVLGKITHRHSGSLEIQWETCLYPRKTAFVPASDSCCIVKCHGKALVIQTLLFIGRHLIIILQNSQDQLPHEISG